MKKTKKVVVGSLATIAVSCALIGGATLAYFTDEASTNIAITAGNVEITATVKDDFKLSSMGEVMTGNTFANGGKVEYKDGELIIDRITPGDKLEFDIEVTNKSDIAIKYQTQLTASNALLLSGLDVTIDDEPLTAEGMVVISAWTPVEAYADIDDIHVEIELPKEAGNQYKLQSCKLNVAVNAIQANGEASNLIQVGEHQYIANSAESLIAFAEGLKDGTVTSVEGKVAHLTITKDIDLSGYEWMPISGAHIVIDGANHTISNLNCGATANGKSAFVAGYGATISNLTLENVTAKGAQAAAFIANNQGGGKLENCTLKGNVNITYEEYATEAWGAVGAFFAVYDGTKVENIAVDAGTNITIIRVGFTSNLEGKETEDLLLGYNNVSAAPESEVKKDKSATVTIIEQDYVLDASNNWTVYTAEGLKAFAAEVNGGDNFAKKTVTLGADIDLGNEPWTPIGKNNSYPFNGNFDGGNHTISNLNITGSGTSFKGLFGRTNTGTIQNFTVNNANVEGYLYVAVVAGVPYTASFNNIKVTGHVELNGGSYVGVIGGYNAYGNFTNLTVDVDETSYVKAVIGGYWYIIEDGKAVMVPAGTPNAEWADYRTYVGGVIGFDAESKNTISNVYCNIDVIGDNGDIGGIAGMGYSNVFENCVYEGTVTVLNKTSISSQIGGIIGTYHTYGSNNTILRGCTFNGKIVAPEGVVLNDNMLTGTAYTSSAALVLEGTNTVNGVEIN